MSTYCSRDVYGATCRERLSSPKKARGTKVDRKKKRGTEIARDEGVATRGAANAVATSRNTFERRVHSASAHPPDDKNYDMNAYRLHQSPQLARGPDVLVLFPSPATSAAATSAAAVTAATSIATVTAAAKTARNPPRQMLRPLLSSFDAKVWVKHVRK